MTDDDLDYALELINSSGANAAIALALVDIGRTLRDIRDELHRPVIEKYEEHRRYVRDRDRQRRAEIDPNSQVGQGGGS